MIIIYPLLSLIFLHFLVLVYMFNIRTKDLTKNKIHPQRVATRAEAQSLYSNTSASDNFQNLFEMPVVFYTLTLLIIVFKFNSNFLVILAWLYVLSRYVHSYIHCTYNKVMHRFYAFAFNNLILIIYFLAVVFFSFRGPFTNI